MAHLLEEYAKNLGVKFSKPIVKDHFFPLSFDKYITISQEATHESKTYPYFNVVLGLLKPFLDRAKIKVLQLGGKERIEGTDQALNLSFKQQGFVLSKSLVHIGPDGALNHLSSSKNIPTITIFGNTFANANRPLFSECSSSNLNLSPDWDKKPCFSNIDPQRQIASIKAEVIAQSILDFLDIEKEDISFSTKHIGAAFLNKSVEVIPTSFSPLRLLPNQVLSIRSDYGVDENALLEYCNKYKVCIFSDKLIQPHGLQSMASNVNNFFLLMDKGWDNIPDNYFKLLKNLNIDVILLSKDKNDLPFLRNKYFDIPVKSYYEEREALCEVTEKTQFISSLRLIEGGKEYLSYAHWKKGLDNNNKVIDSPEYWRESDHFYIYESE